MKKVASSAYIKILKLSDPLLRLLRRPIYCAFLISLCKSFIAKMKSKGDSGSPCLTPRQCKILSPDSLFTRKVEEEVFQSEAIQFLHLKPNPRCSITLNKYGQLTVSKALTISSFMKSEGFFLLCKSLITYWT
jgi:hypothetical protein